MAEPQFLVYRTEAGNPEVRVRFEDETVWLTQAQMADLFQTSTQNVTMHIRGVYDEGELEEGATCKEFLQVRTEGARTVQRNLLHYNLDVIISVGYRVKSNRGVQFRQWATRQLREFLVKGFLLNDRRFKEAGGDRYFEELLQRIRDIRSSEKLFYKKVLDVYATSVDYDPNTEASNRFFATVQNKMHWAAHGHTAAEIVSARADSTQPNMGMTNFPGTRPLKSDARVAKNYLGQQELDALNRIVTLYLDFAELQAVSRRTMTMAAWIDKLDEFLRVAEREVLTHAGTVSHDDAKQKAELEYERWRRIEANRKSAVEADFERAIEASKRLKPPKRGKKSE